MELPQNPFKHALKSGKAQIGLWSSLSSGYTVEVIAGAGFDWILLDMEHSPISLETTSIICAGCHGLGITPLVRPPSHAADWISRVLDGGAQGLIVPHVSNAKQAKAIVSAARFPPLGERSVMGATPALAYRSLSLAVDVAMVGIRFWRLQLALGNASGVQNLRFVASFVKVPGP